MLARQGGYSTGGLAACETPPVAVVWRIRLKVCLGSSANGEQGDANQVLQQTAHAKEGRSGFNVFSRVRRLLSLLLRTNGLSGSSIESLHFTGALLWHEFS